MTRTILIILAILLLTLIAGASDIGNNCCNLPDRNCQTNGEWTQGYYDFVNNQCQPPASAAQSQTATQPTPTPEPTQSADASQDIDNCCFLGWQCESDAQWNSGYFAHQAGDACTTASQQSYQRRQTRNAQSSSRSAASGQSDSEETDGSGAGRVIDHGDGRVEYIYEDGTSNIVQRPIPPDFSDHKEKVCAPLEELGLPCPL